MIKLSNYVIAKLEEIGVSNIFLIPGGGCIHLVDSLGKSSINNITNLHEQGSSICAEAYSQYTENIGVALVTTGPGATNAMTGIASAWLDSIPLLVITGQVQRKDRAVGRYSVRQLGFQEIDTVSLVKNITKYAVTVTDPNDIVYHMNKALHLAMTGRPGPVVLDMPSDVQAANINLHDCKPFKPKPDLTDVKDITSKVIDGLNKAKRPIILVGNGVRLSKGVRHFKQFIEKTKIPVLTTWKALDIIPEDHPLYVGRPGGVGQRGANFNQQNSDFIICLGARLDHGQLAYQPQFFVRDGKKVINDIDQGEIDKLGIDVDYPVVCDSRKFLTELIRQSDNIDIDTSKWLLASKAMYLKYPIILPEYYDAVDYVDNYVFIKTLSDQLEENSLLIPGSSGACSEVTMQAFHCKQGTRVLNSQGLGAMGFGIPASIGGCIASGKRKTVCIDGDGGFVMNVQELELVDRYKLPIKYFVLNNNGYGSIKATQTTHFNGAFVSSDPSSGLTLPSIKKTAAAYNINYIKINNHDDLNDKMHTVLQSNEPYICEVMVNPNHKTQPKASVYKKSDGTFCTRPMEDLAPFLSRDEFNRNMLVSIVDE
tara:strand:- start:156 stop:1943 length:1788 start_codon:yes stop_codon:yes gene_type:complete